MFKCIGIGFGLIFSLIFFLIIGGFGIFVLSFPLPLEIGSDYSEGHRTGEVYKFSYKGLFNKSWEGTMYLGGVSMGDNGLVMDEFSFSIPKKNIEKREDIINIIEECAKGRHICTIEYSQYLKPNYWTMGSSYSVTGAKIEK